MVQINGTSVLGSLSVAEAVGICGRDWTIEPISTFRAAKDLLVDSRDFFDKYALLEPFGDESDKAHYESLIREYYASGTLAYNQDYMGDSMFLHAHHLIEKYPTKKREILKAIDGINGIGLYEKECNLYPYHDSAKKIDALVSQMPLGVLQEEVEGILETMGYYDEAESLLCAEFGVQRDEDSALETMVDNIGIEKIKEGVKHSFGDFKVAFYAGDFACKDLLDVQKESRTLLEAIGAEVVDFTYSVRGDGFDIVAHDKDIAFKKAGAIIFDAIDSGAEILVVDSKETHFMIDQQKRQCEKAIGRDIRVPVLNISQIVALSLGHSPEKLGINEHKIVVEFV
jgi:hypothetical protein